MSPLAFTLLVVTFCCILSQELTCHYLGNRKTIEYAKFPDFNKILVTLTTPTSIGWKGLGFSKNMTLNSATLIIASKGLLYQVQNHTLGTLTQDLSLVIDANINTVDSLFQIGPQYDSMSLFLSLDALENQKYIYFAESSISLTSNVTPIHEIAEIYAFSILNSSPVNCTNFLAPLRAEIYHPAPYAIVLALYVVIFGLLLGFSWSQPLKSRGLSPFLTVAFLFLQLLMEMKNYFTIDSPQSSLCLYYAYGIFPLIEVVFMMNFLYFVRYFIVINLKDQKNLTFDKMIAGQVVQQETVLVKILKAMSTIWFSGLSLALFLIFIYAIYSITLGSSLYVCQFSTLITIKSLHQAILIIIYTSTLVLLLVDSIMNFQLTAKFRCIKYIFLNDPHYFRFQIFLFVPYMIYNIVTEAYIFFSTFDFAGVYSTFTISLALNTINVHLLLILNVLVPLVLTIFHTIQRCARKKPKAALILEIINDEATKVMFSDYCKQEWALENLLCFIDIQLYKKGQKPGKEIYDQYFSGAMAPMEVNMNRGICKNIETALLTGESPPDVFMVAEQTVLTNLADTYGRFMQTSRYQRYLKAKAIKNELMDTK